MVSLLHLLLLLPSFLFFVEIKAALTSDSFTYNGFIGSGLRLDGIAEVAGNGLLVMTNTTMGRQGHAFHPSPLQFKNSNRTVESFATNFAFAITSEYADVSAHGLAFVLSPTRGRPGALANQYLGLFNQSDNGSPDNHVAAVELDTIYNVEFDDPDNNHVGIDIDGLRSAAAAPAAYYSGGGKVTNVSLYSGEPMLVWVEYSREETKLNVTIAPINAPKPEIPLLSLPVDLSPVIEESMFVGFSSSSGSVRSLHYVLGWSFRINGEAPPLDLARLPSLPVTKRSKKKAFLLVGLPLMGGSALLTAAILCAILAVQRRIRYAEVVEDWEKEYRTHRFSYRELFEAAKGFRETELLGIGGFGRVYKGKLPSTNTEVAIKRVSHDSREGTMRGFVAEIVSIGRLRHRHLVRLFGYCRRKGELFLVYELVPNGSLDKHLFCDAGRAPPPLDWARRVRIVRGVASALFYLHEGWEKVVVHRDIKAGNVLLDEEMNAKLGDFGLSRLYDRGGEDARGGGDARATHVVGTMGYMAPELARTGMASPASDVYAFGVFLLEVACGRRPIPLKDSAPNLVDWVWGCWRRGAIRDAVDRRLGIAVDGEGLEMVLRLGLMCAHPDAAARPRIGRVMQYLDGELPLPPPPPPPPPLSPMEIAAAEGGGGAVAGGFLGVVGDDDDGVSPPWEVTQVD